MARRDTSPRPVLRPEGFGAAEQTERMLQPEGDPVAPTEVLKTGITKEVMDKAQEYVSNPPPPKQQSPVQKAIDKDLIGGAEEDYEIKVSKVTPEGRGAIRGMISRVLGKEFDGDLDAFYYCTTFVSDMLDSIGADPLNPGAKPESEARYGRVRADAYMKYGTPVDIEDIQEGDIVIFDFPKLPDGTLTLDPNAGGKRNGRGDHATFYAGDRLDVNKPGSNYIGVLGGEQGGGSAISMKAFDKSHILGVRRIQYNDIDYEFTKELAKVNPDFNKFLNNEAKAFDFNAFMEQSSNPIQGTNRLTSGFDKGGLTEQTDSMLPAVDDDTRSTEEYLEDIKPMDISSVPAFQRPMDASENDKPTGNIDETGAIEYRTALGNTYLVRRNPDQRTTRTKIEEDVLPAVREYLADPTAPTADQAIAAAKAIAGDAWETISIPGDLLSGEKGASDVTLGEVFELTGGTAAASTMFDVPGGRDTLRIFGGANAKYPPNMTGYGSIDSTFNAEADFKTLENLSVDFENDPAGSMARVMDEVERNPDKYPSTLKEIVAGNWFRGRDNMMRFEIDDSKSSVKNMDIITDMDEYDMDAYIEGSDFKSGNVFPDSSIQGMPGEKAFTTLEDVLEHDELYNQYPELKNAPVINDVEYFDKHPSTSGYFDPASGAIAINPKLVTTPEQLRATLIHEIQHLVQHLEGFESGTHSSSMEVFQIKTALKDSPTAKKALEDYENNVKVYDAAQPKVYEQVLDKNAEVARKLLDLALDKVEKDTGVSAAEIFQGFSENKLLSQIIKEKTGKNYVNFNVESLRNVADRRADTYGSSFVGTKVGSNLAENSRYDDYLGYLSEEDRLDALQGINRKSGFIIQEALKKFDTADGEFASEFLKTFGYPIGELKRQNFFDKDPSKVAKFYGINAPDKPVRPAQFGNHLVYTLKRGETEARLAAARKDIPGSERNPENVFDQEDVPPESQWGEPELKRVKKGEDVFVGYKKRPSASESYRDNPSVELEVEKAFEEVANTQRGNPELAMVEAQKIYGGGVMPNALEHIGDLTHRMAERGGRFGSEYVAPKVTRMLNSLLSDYGFEKEMLENIQSNARFKYERDNPDIPFEQYKKEYEDKIDKALKKYSEAHKKVPVYNQMQLAGREAAIAIGEKRYTDAIEQLYIIDQAIKDGTYKQAALEFDPNIDFRKKNGFAEGGTVDMNQQMSFAFEDGGLRDDGMMRDPVSGNEVPPGSTAKEVRDDIPAQLSEGEYVVPADVVRYYGVKFFEDLRDNAKMGLQDMEARGRIGGEPVPAGGPMDGGDLSPEELAAIQEMMGMAEGGVVNMYKQQQDLYSPPNPAIGNPTTTGMASGGEVRGYQPGGLTQQQQAEQGFYTAGQQAQNAGFIGFPLGSTIFPSAGTGTTFTSPTAGTTAFTPVNMINMQTGVRVTATTQADYDRYISEGYVVDDGTLQPKNQGSGGGGGGGPTPPPTEPYKDWLASADFNSAEGLEKFVAGITYDPTKDQTTEQAFGATLITGSPIAGLATAVGGSARGGLNAISDLRAASLIAKAQGLDKLAAKYDKQVADIIEKGPGILDFLDDFLATGKQKGNAWARKNGFENIDKAIEAGVTPKPSATPPKPPAQPGGDGDGDGPVWAGAGRQEGFDAGTVGNLSGTTTAEKTTAVEEATAGIEKGPAASEGATTASTAGGGTTAGGANLDTAMGISGLNKGGLMATPKKKAKRQYRKGGMASKK